MNKKLSIFLVITTIMLISCQPTAASAEELTEKQALTQVFETMSSMTTIPGSTESTEVPESKATPGSASGAINPLTGLAVDDASILDRRPIMVKVSNYPQYGRPHAGLSFADIVFDYYIGYGMNRFLAVFYGQDSSMIGPVRSGRFVDAQLVTMYNGVLAYGSADEDTDAELTTKLGDYAISNLEAAEPVFEGTDTHSVVGVFTNSAELSKFVSEKGLSNSKPDLHGMTFSKTVPNHGKYADQVNILFNYQNRGEWYYDAGSGKYMRWIEYFEDEEDKDYDMIPLVDRVTGDQLGFSNVIIIYAKYTEEAPSRYLIDIWGNNKGRKAHFFRDGQVFEGTWTAGNDADPMQFFNDVGEPMALKPGNTWIVIAGLNSSFEEISTNVWELFFSYP